MRIFTYLFTAILTAVILSGCFFSRSAPTTIYTLATAPNISNESTAAVFVGFRDCSGTGRDFMCKVSEYKVVRDEFSCWQQSPSELLTSYLRQSFATESEPQKTFYIQGSFNSFIIDIPNKEVSFQLNYTISRNETDMNPERFSGRYRAYFKEATPEAFARAYSKAAAQCAADLKKKMIAMNKVKSTK